jgi:hypothetical protein
MSHPSLDPAVTVSISKAESIDMIGKYTEQLEGGGHGWWRVGGRVRCKEAGMFEKKRNRLACVKIFLFQFLSKSKT